MSSSPRTPGWLAPTPPTVAIEIAARRVTVVEIAGGASPTVSALASESLPDSSVTPSLAGPNVPDPAPVVEALRRALERAGMRAPKRAALVIPDSAARVSLLTFEQVPPRAADFEQLVRWQLRKSMPFPIEEAAVSTVITHAVPGATTVAAVVARRDVVAQYEAVTSALGIHAGLVDIASFNVLNAVVSAGAAPAGDWLLVCVTPESTSLAIVRGVSLMFYRHRAAVDEEPLSALVHQTAMYHEDRLGGSQFSRVLLCGASLVDAGADRIRREISDRLGLAAEPVDARVAAALRDRINAGPDVLDALAAPVGVLLRERRTA